MTSKERLLSYYKKYWKPMTLGSIGVMMSAGIGLLGPIVVRYAIDGIDKASPETVTPILLRYGAIIVAIAIAKGIFLYSQRMIMVGMSRDIEYDLRNEFYDHLQNLPQQFYQEYRTGDLMARATNDLNAVRMLAGPAIMYGEGTLFNTVIALPLMFSINWKLTLLALCSLPFVSFATNFFAKRIHQRFESIQEYFSTITAQAQENFSGVRVVRAYAQETREIEAFEKMNHEFVGRNMKLIKLTGVFHPMLQALVGLGFVAVLWYGGRLTLAHEMSVGQYVQFNLYLVMLIWPMIALGWVVNLFQRGMASMNRINTVLEIKPIITNERAQKDITEIHGEIEFRNLTFKYPGTERYVLKDINLKIKHGQTVAIVGHTGSGKSTLVNLVPRLIDAEPGQVLIDGHPIVNVPLEVVRSNIGYVPQETFLFSETVGGNIAFGTPNATPQDVKYAAESAGLLDDIEGFPKGFDTVVGERGITLSGGQKQRTAIARSVIRRPKILLLDDSLSAVDTYTEEKILSHLRGIMSGRTSIIVSHRVSTVKGADLIVVLQDGEIVECGTHDELLRHDGLYAQLHEEQLLEEELAASQGKLRMAEGHEEEVLGKAYDSRLMSRLLVYLRPHWPKVLFSILLLSVVAALELAGPTLTNFTVDHIIKPVVDGSPAAQSGGHTTQLILRIGNAIGVSFEGMHGLNVIGVIYLFLLVAGFVFNYFQTVVMSQVGQYIMYDLRAQIFSHLQRADIRFYDKNPVGRIMTRLTTDVDALNELFSSGVVALFGDLFTIIAITIWMLSENWRLALVTFTIVPAFVAITVWFRKGARDTYRQVRIRIARINAFLQEHITGMSVVQLFNREKKEMDRFVEINEDHRQANVRSVFYYAIFFPAIDIVSAAGVGLLVWYGGGQVVHKTLSLGALIAFLQLAQRFYNPIRDISEKYNILQAAMASSERIFRLLDTPLGVVSPEHPTHPTNWRGEIEFRNVWFAYNAEGNTIIPGTDDDAQADGIEWVLRDVSFKVSPGESVAIVGHTGAGKTTITNLLLRFYDIQSGQILLDGVDIRELDLQDLRKNFSIVLQDVFLYTGDVSSNIRLGNAAISDDRVRFAAREVHADEFVQRLPQGYATEVRERGAGLSVGQKQLLAFARALAFDPRVLILDEATSSIDTETELLIRDALKRLMIGRTSIIIAHRLSTIQSCDKIIVMHKGLIREMGAHQELLALRGIYFRLYQLQYREQALDPMTQLAGGD